MTTSDPRELTPPAILRDLPMGTQGTRGRLLMVAPGPLSGDHRFVFYRGSNMSARAAVAGCPLGELKAMHERRSDVERRTGRSSDLGHAIALALDLPGVDAEVARIVRYIEATAK